MLEGEALSADDSAALDGLLLSADEQTKAHLRQDVQNAQALRAAYSSTRSSSVFVESVLDQVQEQSLRQPPVPPPVVASQNPSQQIRVQPATRQPNRSSSNVWFFAVVACCLLMVCGVGYFLISDGGQGGRGTETEKVASAPSRVPNTKIEQPESPQESLVADPQEPVGDSIVKDTPPKQEAQDPVAVNPPAKLVQTEPVSDQPKQNDPIQLAPDDSPSTGPNQAIVASNDAVWGDGGLPDQALLQPIDLVSGTASITLASGAVVEISGPTGLQIKGPNKADLLKGSAQIHVPEPAVGFEINVAGARIVDLGTRFSVASDPNSRFTIVTVTEGKVEAFQPPINRRARERKTRLIAGKTKWFPKEGTERAFDWVLKVDFQYGNSAVEKVTIADVEFDLTNFGAASQAKLALKEQFDFAVRQLELVERGERFAGLLIHNGKEQMIDNKKHLTAIQAFLSEQITGTNIGPLNPVQMMQEMQQRMKSLMQQP